MSEAQRCANVMRRYGLGYDRKSIERGCYEATSRELDRQEARIAELQQQLEAARKDVAQLRALVNQSLEAMQWILGGEPIDTLMIDAVNAIKLHQAQQSKKGGKA